MNALTEAAALELAEFGIRGRVVVPGAAPGTSSGNTARARIAAAGGFSEPYADFAGRTKAAMQRRAVSAEVTSAQDVAQAVYRAATDPHCPMLLAAGADAVALSEDR